MYSPMGSVPADRPAPTSAVAPQAPAPYAPPAVVFGAYNEDAAIGATVPFAAAAPSPRRFFGVSTDFGLPDGANLGLVVRPASWIRLHAAGGSNSANVGFGGGVTLIPYWFWHIGPSLTFEGGFCRMGDVNVVLRTFFQVPAWMKDYAQQAGYSYFNSHLGLEFGRGRVTGFIHVGGSYVDGTVRTPNPVCVQTSSTPCSGGAVSPDQTQLRLGEDAKVKVYTISGKAGIIVYFGGI